MSSSFTWKECGISHSDFIATANVFPLISRQLQSVQIEQPTSDEIADDEGSKDYHLKRRFLDRFAEVLSTEKGAQHVACAIMQEETTSATFWVSRNEGFYQRDKNFMQGFEDCMKDMATNHSSHSVYV